MERTQTHHHKRSSRLRTTSSYRACRTWGLAHRLYSLSGTFQNQMKMTGKNLPYPLDMPRFMTITSLLFQACRTGMPEIGESGSKAIGLTVSFAPITRVTSVSGKSSFISSISRTTLSGQLLLSLSKCGGDLLSYGTEASARSTLHCPGMRPAAGSGQSIILEGEDRGERTYQLDGWQIVL